MKKVPKNGINCVDRTVSIKLCRSKLCRSNCVDQNCVDQTVSFKLCLSNYVDQIVLIEQYREQTLLIELDQEQTWWSNCVDQTWSIKLWRSTFVDQTVSIKLCRSSCAFQIVSIKLCRTRLEAPLSVLSRNSFQVYICIKDSTCSGFISARTCCCSHRGKIQGGQMRLWKSRPIHFLY
jgi:hypothetical protein